MIPRFARSLVQVSVRKISVNSSSLSAVGMHRSGRSLDTAGTTSSYSLTEKKLTDRDFYDKQDISMSDVTVVRTKHQKKNQTLIVMAHPEDLQYTRCSFQIESC